MKTMNGMNKTKSLRMLVAAAFLALAPVVQARADARMEENLKLAPGGKFVLDADAGSVTIRGVSASGAKVVVTSRRDDLKERFDFKFEEGPGTVTVTARKKGGLLSWFSWSGDGSPRFEIEVPTETGLQIETGGGHLDVSGIRSDAQIRTSGGHIEVSELSGKLVARTSGGHIELRGISGDAKIETSGGHIDAAGVKGSLDARTSGGHIDVRDVTGDLKVDTSGGHIQIEGAGGRVDAETSGGSVGVIFTRGNSRGGSLGTSGGNIRVKLDGGSDLTVDAEAGGGSVTSSLPVTVSGRGSRSSLRGALGKGGETLRIRASGGSIQIDSL